jgi:BolA-like protein 1
VVSEAFQGLNLVKRHKLVYQVLKDCMPHIHALQIRAQTPSEAGL